MRKITDKILTDYRKYLINEEKSAATLEKYMRDVTAFYRRLSGRALCKEEVLGYKEQLSQSYAVSSVNSILSSLNSFFTFCGWHELKVKSVKLQRRIFASRDKELTKAEYESLLSAARSGNNQRLYLLMQTICSTGIRVSELKFITAEAICKGYTDICCKGKRRTVFLPSQLCKSLKSYVKERKIKSGSVFITKNGAPLDRSNIWSDMKRLCKQAGVSEEKVFPHNLRHLFARTYYSLQKDIVRLADILGHSNVNTTRIYTMESGETHRRQLQKLGLLLC